jgi:hypothetical protein
MMLPYDPTMALTEQELTAKGRILRTDGEYVVFAPAGTNYQLHLKPANAATAAAAKDVPVRLRIRATGRKLLTVPSGGNFVAPIFGTPKTFQGRVRAISGSTLTLHAGVTVEVQLPGDDHAIDLNNGAITVGQMVNVIVHPGVTAELV